MDSVKIVRTFKVSVVMRTVPCYIEGENRAEVEQAVKDVFKNQFGGDILVNVSPAYQKRAEYVVSPEGNLIELERHSQRG